MYGSQHELNMQWVTSMLILSWFDQLIDTGLVLKAKINYMQFFVFRCLLTMPLTSTKYIEPINETLCLQLTDHPSELNIFRIFQTQYSSLNAVRLTGYVPRIDFGLLLKGNDAIYWIYASLVRLCHNFLQIIYSFHNQKPILKKTIPGLFFT